MLDVGIRLLAKIMVPMFILGMAGSAIVVAITLTRDLTDFLLDSGNEDRSGESLS